MSNAEARLLVVLHFRSMDMAVYCGEQAIGKRSMPDLIVMDRDTGATARVRVMVAKDPRKTGATYYAKDRVGDHSDVVAVVNANTGALAFRASETPTPRSAAPAPVLAAVAA